MDFKRRIFCILTSFLAMVGMATARINISFERNVTTLAELGGLLTDLVDVGLDVLVHVLQRYPEIAVLILVVGVILLILAMIRGVFGTVGGFFSGLTKIKL